MTQIIGSAEDMSDRPQANKKRRKFKPPLLKKKYCCGKFITRSRLYISLKENS
ncbi:MAG: hypothetical protein RID09_27355 [Coleofasciculus sp. G1-WW12-02]|uniref:hypothetical protein n=1 Tax=Coleofasciculus sp. G1-WW12-02 TaxID=3068483 RepID=UPI003302DAFA